MVRPSLRNQNQEAGLLAYDLQRKHSWHIGSEDTVTWETRDRGRGLAGIRVQKCRRSLARQWGQDPAEGGD